MDSTTARITYGIVPVSLDELKKEYLEHLDDWELPSPIVPLFADERAGGCDELPNPEEIWLRLSQFMRSTTSPRLVRDYNEWVAHLSDNPTFEAIPSEWIWPLHNGKPNPSGLGEKYIDIP